MKGAIRQTMRRTWHALKHRQADLAQPVRRRLAVARLKKHPRPANVLVLCTGNICRSPYAHAALRRRLNGHDTGDIEVRSAGFVGPGRPAHPDAIQVAKYRSVDLSSHKSRLVTEALVRDAELIVVMDPAHGRALRVRFGVGARVVLVLGDLDPEAIETRAIRDPLDQGLEVFQETYARIDRCIEGLVTAIGAGSSNPI